MGQFLTPPDVAGLMASMFEGTGGTAVQLLEAGAGVGSLAAAFVAEVCRRESKPRSIEVTAYEIDALLAGYLELTLANCAAVCRSADVPFDRVIAQTDFIAAAVQSLNAGLFSTRRRGFNFAVLNPPYRKIHTQSEERRLLRSSGIETSNLYTGFLSLVVQLLEPGGQLVAITPRSFCNGPYFRPFRELFLDAMALRRIHIFDSRDRAFKDDAVLQENVIIYAVKGGERGQVAVSSSTTPDDDLFAFRRVSYGDVVRPRDPQKFIHIVPDALGEEVSKRMLSFAHPLHDLRLEVSTGRVVDFRAREHLREKPDEKSVPLIYPGHFSNGGVVWPKDGKKPNAIVACSATEPLLLPRGVYVLVKRFSAKEERRRVVAAVYDPKLLPNGPVAFENHLNVFHRSERGLPMDLARGLAAFLNSTLLDAYFRQFNGHTQVNATDLRSLRYPSEARLTALGRKIGPRNLTQDEIDDLVESELVDVSGPDPVKAQKRIDEGLAILKAFGLPRAQQNVRSSLTLLALLDVKPTTSWRDASNPLRGITPMMDFMRDEYGKTYAPNTRETVRRQTIHQFVQAGLAVLNPDDPKRPINSPANVYQIEPEALKVIRTFGTPQWEAELKKYLGTVETLAQRYAQARQLERLPVDLGSGSIVTLSPGGQNDLIKKIVEEFCSRFTPGGQVLYLGDADNKWVINQQEALQALGLEFDEHGKMPDVVVHHLSKDWLVLIEAVTSHGPVDPKRHNELKELFSASRVGLVFVTAFPDRPTLVRYLRDISWETEVWIADAPDHLIHFNGERFLGPYPDTGSK